MPSAYGVPKSTVPPLGFPLESTSAMMSKPPAACHCFCVAAPPMALSIEVASSLFSSVPRPLVLFVPVAVRWYVRLGIGVGSAVDPGVLTLIRVQSASDPRLIGVDVEVRRVVAAPRRDLVDVEQDQALLALLLRDLDVEVERLVRPQERSTAAYAVDGVVVVDRVLLDLHRHPRVLRELLSRSLKYECVALTSTTVVLVPVFWVTSQIWFVVVFGPFTLWSRTHNALFVPAAELF